MSASSRLVTALFDGERLRQARLFNGWRKIDPKRPILLNFSGGNVWFTTGDNAQCDGPGDGTATDDCYPAFIASADWIGVFG